MSARPAGRVRGAAFARLWKALTAMADFDWRDAARAAEWDGQATAAVIRLLRRSGHVEAAPGAGARLARWRVTEAGRKDPPKEDPRGARPSRRDTLREHLWSALRQLRGGAAREIAFAASTDEIKITPATADTYLRALARGGAVVVEGEGRKRRYRLKPSANTGPAPLAPMRQGARIVIVDPNVSRRRVAA